MALDGAVIEDLIQKLAEDRDNYLKNIEKTHDILIRALRALNPQSPAQAVLPSTEVVLAQQRPQHHPGASSASSNQTTLQDVDSYTAKPKPSSTLGGSTFEDELDDPDPLFIKKPLDAEDYQEEDLRQHILGFNWNSSSRQIIRELFDDPRTLRRKSLFPMELGELDHRSFFTHYSIFTIGDDGAPLQIKDVEAGPVSRPIQIWRRIRSTNMQPERRKAVGKIVIVREPSALLFAALHLTMNKHFDMDHLYELLFHDDPVITHPHQPFADDHRRQRSFTIALEYFTIVGEQCVPMHWQKGDGNVSKAHHIPLTRCSSVISLSLEGPPLCQLRNKHRRAQKKDGNVYDPFSPWRVLSIQAYPDWRSNIDAHDGSKQYVNGPMAFLVTLQAELGDAYKRLIGVYKAIADLVEPPANFIFDETIRDKLLFEDEEFTYSRRYFWAAQTLGIMNEDIRNIIDAYHETFTDAVWEGTDKIIWPSNGFETSQRHIHWRKRMAACRKSIEFEIRRLQEVEQLNEKKMRFIKTLNDSLFSGTSVSESRHSVQLAKVTVAQGDNIRLLTLVTILFLPLSFVTSVFGMTNLPSGTPFHNFAYVGVAVCLPFWILIGSLNSSRGMAFWKRRYRKLSHQIAFVIAHSLNFFFRYRPLWARRIFGEELEELVPVTRPTLRRTGSLDGLMRTRPTFDEMRMNSTHKLSSSGLELTKSKSTDYSVIPFVDNGSAPPSSPPLFPIPPSRNQSLDKIAGSFPVQQSPMTIPSSQQQRQQQQQFQHSNVRFHVHGRRPSASASISTAKRATSIGSTGSPRGSSGSILMSSSATALSSPPPSTVGWKGQDRERTGRTVEKLVEEAGEGESGSRDGIRVEEKELGSQPGGPVAFPRRQQTFPSATAESLPADRAASERKGSLGSLVSYIFGRKDSNRNQDEVQDEGQDPYLEPVEPVYEDKG